MLADTQAAVIVVFALALSASVLLVAVGEDILIDTATFGAGLCTGLALIFGVNWLGSRGRRRGRSN